MTNTVAPRPAGWKWMVCGLLFLATMLMYMDRQTLATMAKRICDELQLSNQQYGQLEMGFGLAFAVGAIVNGLIADRVNVRWLYPVMLVGWSVMGIATAYSVAIGEMLLAWFGWTSLYLGREPPTAAFAGLMFCRVLLGFFESGHWPCALITTQRILTARDRTFGNSILQSGASIGAVLTPLVVEWMLWIGGSWREPFLGIGLAGMLWLIPWLWMVQSSDLARAPAAADQKENSLARAAEGIDDSLWIRRALILLAIVIPINLTWQFFRAWLAKMLQDQHGYSETFVLRFNSGYYLVADLGCIAAGAAVKSLATRGWNRQTARLAVFATCTAITCVGVLAAYLPAGAPLLGVLLAVGFGCLGLFPIYYALTQEISPKHQGLITGVLGFSTWIVYALLQPPIGRLVDETKSYNIALFWISLVPLIACAALLFWGRMAKQNRPPDSIRGQA